jgi:phosphoribosylformylglycinamidine synthase
MVKRIFVEKKKGYDIEAQGMFRDLKQNLKIEGLTGIRIIICYDVEGIDKKQYEKARNTIFSEPQVDVAYDEIIRLSEDERVFAVQYLPGQYDQQADFCRTVIQILTTGKNRCAGYPRVYMPQQEI